ncbi:MAG: hypothetical protein LBE86_13565 [Gemmobacter sp.]|jgi:hypothetical protein|nr:hypothetical protein [Gemmobacter sp.]
MNRRDLLTAAPAAGFAALVGCTAPVEAMAETPVYRAFCHWRDLKAQWDAAIARGYSDVG